MAIIGFIRAAALLALLQAAADPAAAQDVPPDRGAQDVPVPLDGAAPAVASPGRGALALGGARRAANGAAARGAAAPSSATPGTGSAPGATIASGASGTAGGIGGAQRAGAVQGVTAAPTLPTIVPPGTLDLGHGVTAVFNYTGEAAGNPYGGLAQGGRYADQFALGVDIDLGKLAGSPGTFLHAIGTQRDGHSLTNDLVGNSISVQEIYGGGQTYRLTYLSIEQRFTDWMDIEIGRLPGQVAFLANPLHCNFQNNTICGSPSIIFADTNFTYYPAPTWGGTAKFKLTDKYFFNIGAYEVAPTSTLRTDHGVDFFAPATGFNVPFELGYATTFDNDPYPRHVGVGAVIDRSSYNDAVLDTEGNSFLLSGLSPEQRFGRSMVYGRYDQMVYRPDMGSPRGLTLFGIALGATGGRQIEDYYLGLGAVYLGPFESRPYDSIDAFVSTQAYSNIGLSNVRAFRQRAGLSTDVPTNQTFFELNYGIQVTPAIRVTPNLQYILDPDQLRFPQRLTPIPDTLVIGTKVSVDLFTLAGLAKGPGSP